MITSDGIRRFHRWTSIAFTAFVIANFVALGIGRGREIVGGLTVIPLVLLLVSGLYLFALPWSARRRRERRAA